MTFSSAIHSKLVISDRFHMKHTEYWAPQTFDSINRFQLLPYLPKHCPGIPLNPSLNSQLYLHNSSTPLIPPLSLHWPANLDNVEQLQQQEQRLNSPSTLGSPQFRNLGPAGQPSPGLYNLSQTLPYRLFNQLLNTGSCQDMASNPNHPPPNTLPPGNIQTRQLSQPFYPPHHDSDQMRGSNSHITEHIQAVYDTNSTINKPPN